ncbi:YdcF family protein, partial [Novosphingobium sp. 1949]
DLACLAQALVWRADERAVFTRAAAPLIRSGAPDDGAAAQLTREIEGIDTILETYGLGAPPAYPEIDGAGTITPAERESRLQAASLLAQTPREASLQSLDPSLEFALALLDGSDRDDAIRFEPITGGLNAPAMARAARLDWSRYRYSAMIVTGIGPEIDGQPLSPLGKAHLRLAAARFARGDVPFIVFTGGHAHPRATRFAEAVEMRRALIARYGVPADAIVIEPYARHTTTNLRNAARRLAMLGAPAAMPALIVCNPQQSAYIESPAFTQRNTRELGYQPGRVLARLSPTELVFAPAPQVDRIDPRDPLDP